MTKVILHGANGEIGRRNLLLCEALDWLKLIKEVGNVIYDGRDLNYSESYCVLPTDSNSTITVNIYMEEVE